MGTRDDSSSVNSDTEEEGGPLRLTRKWIVEFFKKNWKDYYRTIELNEKLYFHYKGFRKIACMELFPDLKCLYFEGNGLEKISGLTTNTQLMSLFLQENVIEKMEGLDFCTRLRTLNLSNCCIRKIEGLRTVSRAISWMILIQLATGISTVLLDWPLALAVVHNAGAAALLILLVMLMSMNEDMAEIHQN